MQADATLLANSSRHCGMLHVASVSHPVACCYMFLRVVGSCCAKVESGQTFGPANSQHFFCSVIVEAWDRKTMLDPFAQLFHHCWGRARALVTHGVQSLIGCILPTMRCRSQHCSELLHPFAHHCQHERNNSQHCWSQQCWELFHRFALHCHHERNNSQHCWSQQCWELLRPFARSLNCGCCSPLDFWPYNGFCEI